MAFRSMAVETSLPTDLPYLGHVHKPPTSPGTSVFKGAVR